ncbi:two-component regulator propeller domain-containing protein [Labilibaculum sp.]|uniref:two-component regulator propeller domain-containing protein n=1 Tax=Labilibaculum sp. TaxID=2060723 RepID=UPI00356B06E8
MAQNNHFINYGVDNGLPQAYIYSISQNSEGYLWVGTGDGLSCFDGANFINYNTMDSLAGNFISCNLNTPRADWFGHMNGSLTFKDKNGFHIVRSKAEDKSSITDLHQNSNGQIWLSNQRKGLLRVIENKRIEPLIFSEGPFSVNSFQFVNEKDLLLGSNEGVKYCTVVDNQIVVQNTISEIGQNRINQIVKERSGNAFLILSENKNIYHLTVKENAYSVSQIKVRGGLQMESIQNVFEDRNLNLWVSTFGQGVHKLAKDSLGYHFMTTFSTENGLESDNSKLCFEDSEGNIWISVYGKGLSRLIDPAYTFYSPDASYGSTISAISKNAEYEWFGTDKGLLRKSVDNNKELRFYDSCQGLPFDKITSLYQKENDLWIGTEKNGLYRLNISTNRIERELIADGILENSINSINGKNDQLWIATKKGACNYNLTTGKKNWYTISKGGLPHNCVNHIFIDSKDRIWMSTLSSSLVLLENGKVTNLFLSDDNNFINIRSIDEDNEGRIWVGTLGNGVFLYQKDSIVNLSSKDGLLSDYCYSLIADNQNRIWVAHRGGISRINADTFFIKPLQENIGISKSDEFQVNSSFVDLDNNLWFGMNSGLLKFNPSLEIKASIAPVPKIKSIQINEQEIALSDKIVLSPGRYKIKIEFVGIYFKEPELVKYRYILDGYDEDWTQFSTNKQVTYYGVSDGSFDFLLEASNGDGITNEYPLNLRIYIQTPFWKQTWFYLLVLVLLIILIVFYIKGREKILKKENRILEEKVLKRTQEVVKQKEEIEKQRDLIESANKDITDSIKYASRIQAAVIPPVKYLEKILNKSFIINKPKAIVSGDFYWATKMDNKIVLALADCTGHGVPGAFMSMLGVTLLNEIVIHKRITSSHEILNQLRQDIIISLRQSYGDATPSDGMDISLIVMDTDKRELHFSGAFNPLLVVRNGKIIMLKADRMPIGIYHQRMVDFSSRKIDLKTNDMLYLYTDGYSDQFGGVEDKKFTSRKFRDLLLDIHEKPVEEQKSILEKTMEIWMNGTEQIDDITVLGIRI